MKRNQVQKYYTPEKFMSNTFEILFKSDPFKYTVEVDPNPGDNVMSLIGKALRANSAVLKEKFGNSYIFTNNSIYSTNITDKIDLKVIWDEIEYEIKSNRNSSE